ncbi:carboxypeptidase-like regulatory domain-containing protein [Maribacter halichondriae]|uniref:carboxypeptidase-like regulatory domain-containing protein n=1 Tax=Maribacter halichondriae TaxID=2980554 RepID=UPI00235824F2|nr:carboxypeptidase-like regulatory domain-containing protein [Maribacter sp. Hal144]
MKTFIDFITRFVLFLSVCLVNGQQFTDLNGRVTSTDNDVAGTHVMNITTQRATTTDVNGFFTIPVRLNDTIVFSAVQFKRKEIVVGLNILESNFLFVPLEDALTELDEVVVRPYNLSGKLGRDMGNQKIEPVVTASTLELPNAYVKVMTQNERILFEADHGNFVIVEYDTLTYRPRVVISLHKVLNRVSGRTRKLKSLVAVDEKMGPLEKVRKLYPDSVYVQEFKIPEEKLNEFMYFCEADTLFEATVNTEDQLLMWEFLKKKSMAFRKENETD